MTQTLIFHNPGEIDIRGAAIAGLSAKGSDSAIGYFGTGLKYAIASILRWGGQITIYSGTTQHVFEARELDFRGQAFKQVVMSSGPGSPPIVPLGFTTEYGKDWQEWQVFRELYANARDEGGTVTLSDEVAPCEGATAILVSNCPELTKLYYERDEIILPADKSWAASTTDLQFSKAPSSHIYYKSVRVKNARALFTWNFLTGLTLTEDRTLKDNYAPSKYVRRFIKDHCEDESVIETCLRNWKDDKYNDSFEHTAFHWFDPPKQTSECSPAFARVAARLFKLEPVRFKSLRQLAVDFDASLANADAYTLSRREETMLARAKELVSKFGFAKEVSSIPIHVRHLGDSVLGKYEQGEIHLSPNCFEQGTKQVVSTLYEECYHAKTGKEDCTYDMQTSLFNIIISLNEELHGEIC